MNKIIVFFLLISVSFYAQNDEVISNTKTNFYLEDQLYIGVAYNILTKLPNSISQSGFSNSFFVGFIKDLPTNKERNFGFGVGLGYSLDTFFQNLKITEINNETVFENFLDDEFFKNNKLIIHSLDLPIEIRFRKSTLAKYKFWRLYTGVKFKYNFYSRASYENNKTQKTKNIDALEKMNYGLTLGLGHGTWNLHLDYQLKPIFKNATFNGKSIDAKPFKIGLIFYIL